MTINYQQNLEKIINAVYSKHPKCKENGITFIELLHVLSGYPAFHSNGKIISEGEIILIKFPDKDIYWNPKLKLEEQEESVINDLATFIIDAPKETHVYEFITPSDSITFLADDDKIAFACAIIIGRGRAGCIRYDKNGQKEVNLQSLCFFAPDPLYHVNATLGMELNDFIHKNRKEIAEALKTFAYGSIQDRKEYDNVLNAIQDPVAREKFRNTHENTKRTSLSPWVKAAWNLGDNMLKQLSQA